MKNSKRYLLRGLLSLLFVLSCLSFGNSDHTQALNPGAPFTINGRTWQVTNESVTRGSTSIGNNAQVYSGDVLRFTFTTKATGSGDNNIDGLFWASIKYNDQTPKSVDVVDHSSNTTLNTKGCLAGQDYNIRPVSDPKRYNCGKIGYAVYDTEHFSSGEPGGNSPPHTMRFDVRVNPNNSGNDKSFCVRMHAGRYQDRGLHGLGLDPPNPPGKTIPQIINWQYDNPVVSRDDGKDMYDQAVYAIGEQLCYQIKDNEAPSGDYDVLNCNLVDVTAFDRGESTRGTHFRVTYQVVSPGSTAPTTVGGTTIGSSKYRQTVFMPGLSGAFGVGVNVVRIQLDVYDLDGGYPATGGWRNSVVVHNQQRDCATDTSPSMTASATCDSMHVEVADKDTDGLIRIFVRVFKRDTNGNRGGEARPPFNMDISASQATSGAADIPYTSGAVPDDNNGWIIETGVHNEEPDDNPDPGAYIGIAVITIDGPCYQASCSLDVVEPPEPGWPNNGVKANRNFSVNGTLVSGGNPVRSVTHYEDNRGDFTHSPGPASLPGSLGGAQLALTNDRDAWGNPTPAQSSRNINGSPTAPDDEGSTPTRTFGGPGTELIEGIPAAGHPRSTGIGNFQLNYYPDYYGKFRIGGPCSTPVRTYQEFELSVKAIADMKKANGDLTEENPAGLITIRMLDMAVRVTPLFTLQPVVDSISEQRRAWTSRP